MNRRNSSTISLQMGIALALLISSILTPLLWWSEAPSAPPSPPDPFELVRRDEAEVVAEELPAAVDAWDQIKLLAPEPVPAEYQSQFTAKAAPVVREAPSAPLPTEPSPPSWMGELSNPAARIATRLPTLKRTPATPSLPVASPALDLARSEQPERVGLVESPWETPRRLVSQLEQFVKQAAGTPAELWGRQVLAVLSDMNGLPPTSAQLRNRLAVLRQLNTKAREVGDQLDTELRTQLIVANYALTRRLSVWEHASVLGDPSLYVSMVASPDSNQAVDLDEAIRATRAWLRATNATSGWEKFLLLDELSAGVQHDPVARNYLARRLEWRITHVNDPTQAAYANSQPVQQLLASVRQWVSQVAWDDSLVDTIELAEQGDPEAMRRVACMSQSLMWSADERQQQLGKHLNQHYRNANIRVAFNEDFVNGWLEDPEPVVEPFREMILGADVSGKNRVETKLAVELVPSEVSCRFLMQAAGVIRSSTSTSKGPAVVFSSGHSQYLAEKEIMLIGDGASVGPARAATIMSTRLRGFCTDYDGVPLLGGIARSIVRRQHDEQAPRAKRIAEQKSSQRIRQEMDRLVERQLDEAANKLQQRVMEPIDRLHLKADALSMRTTEDRAFLRGRIASDAQLAAFTPRPSAPAGAVVELQIHQSAINNALLGLNLGGRRATIAEVGKDVAKKIGNADWTPDDLPARTQRTIVTFDDEQPLEIQADNGELVLKLRMVELDAGGSDFWYDFNVTATFEPEVEGAQLRFVRKGRLQIEGEAFSIRDVLALRGIFATVFGRDQPLTLIDEELANEKAMKSLELTQCDLTFGWLGLAFEPQTSPATRKAVTATLRATSANYRR